MIKITYIISDIDKALAFEWIATHLDKTTFKLDFILLNKGNSQLEKFLKENDITLRKIKLYHGWKMVLSFFPLWYKLMISRPDIIHTHLRYASLLGITAGYFAGIKKRIYTRHHAASNHHYYPHAVRHDKWVSKLSTHIVAISNVVSEVLIEWEKTDPNKVIKIPHGFDLQMFNQANSADVEKLKTKYHFINNKGPVIGMISRYLHLKGINYVIDAFVEIRKKYPDAHLIMANANGPDSESIKSKLMELPKSAYTEISFEPDVASLYQLFDIFVHVPISKHSEAFGQTYVEALASGIPSIFTLSGIATEFIVNEENALVVPFKNSIEIYNAIVNILINKNLHDHLISNGLKSLDEYQLSLFIHRLEDMYEG